MSAENQEHAMSSTITRNNDQATEVQSTAETVRRNTRSQGNEGLIELDSGGRDARRSTFVPASQTPNPLRDAFQTPSRSGESHAPQNHSILSRDSSGRSRLAPVYSSNVSDSSNRSNRSVSWSARNEVYTVEPRRTGT